MAIPSLGLSSGSSIIRPRPGTLFFFRSPKALKGLFHVPMCFPEVCINMRLPSRVGYRTHSRAHPLHYFCNPTRLWLVTEGQLHVCMKEHMHLSSQSCWEPALPPKEGGRQVSGGAWISGEVFTEVMCSAAWICNNNKHVKSFMSWQIHLEL